MRIITLACLVLIVGVEPAAAHDEVLAVTPSDGQTVATASQVRITFREKPLAVGSAVVVTGPSGRVTGQVSTAQGSLVQVFPAPLPSGQYLVKWQAVSSDSHPITGSFGFTVRASPTPSPTSPSVSSAAASPNRANPPVTDSVPTSGGNRSVGIISFIGILATAIVLLSQRRRLLSAPRPPLAPPQGHP